MKLTCSCGKSYWPQQKWQHASCLAVVVEEVKAMAKPRDEVLKTAPRAKPAVARSSIPVQASPIKHADSIKHRMGALGKVGGPRGGAARAASLSPERRAEIARAAAIARWGKE